MTHAYHDELPGFDERQIWKDGCGECESRGKSLPYSINMLDNGNFARAMTRSIEWNQDKDVGHVSNAERDLLNFLWVMNLNMRRFQAI